jgi:hypothetical protein
MDNFLHLQLLDSTTTHEAIPLTFGDPLLPFIESVINEAKEEAWIRISSDRPMSPNNSPGQNNFATDFTDAVKNLANSLGGTPKSATAASLKDQEHLLQVQDARIQYMLLFGKNVEVIDTQTGLKTTVAVLPKLNPAFAAAIGATTTTAAKKEVRRMRPDNGS